MPKLARIALLLAAALCGGIVAFLGINVMKSYQPETYTITDTALWFAYGAVIATPFWLPALVPRKFSIILNVCRMLSAAVLLLQTYCFSRIVVDNSLISGICDSQYPLTLGTLGAVLTIAYIYSIVILLWPWPEPRQDG